MLTSLIRSPSSPRLLLQISQTILPFFSDDRAFDLVPSAIRLSLCSMKAPMIPSIRGLGNLPLRVPHEEIETRGEEGTQVQRREGEKEFERKKLLEFLFMSFAS